MHTTVHTYTHTKHTHTDTQKTHTTHTHTHTYSHLHAWFLLFGIAISAFRAVCSQIVFHISNTWHASERGRETEKGEERKREIGRRKWERTMKSRTGLSLIHFTVCHSQNSFIFRSHGSLKSSTLNKSRSTHKRYSHYSTAITSFGLHSCVTEGRESRSFFAFLTISIPSNLQKSTSIDCGLRS